MTKDELKAKRKELGLSAQGLANRLGLSKWGGRTIRRWESGEFPIPGPVALAVEGMKPDEQ